MKRLKGEMAEEVKGPAVLRKFNPVSLFRIYPWPNL